MSETTSQMTQVRGSLGGSSVPAGTDYTAYIQKNEGFDILQRDHYRAHVVQYISFVVAASVEQENVKTMYYPVKARTVPSGTVFRYRYYTGSGRLDTEEFYVVVDGKFYHASPEVLKTVKREPLKVHIFPAVVEGKAVIAYQFQYHEGMKDWLKFRGARWEPTKKFWYSDSEIELPADVEIVRE